MSEGYRERWSVDRREPWDLVEVADVLGARILGGGGWSDPLELQWIDVGAPAIDARAVEHGGLFVALQGTRSHGIHHWQQARDRGAVAVLVGSDAPQDAVDTLVAAGEDGLFVLRCTDDGVHAFGRLARAWRRRCGFTVVGITGSSGKTSTKDMLAALLRPLASVAVSTANNNNEIGVPLTLLGASPDADVVICEMGMRGEGQIAYLCDIAAPDVGIVTNAGTAHLELLGSRDAIVRAKAELLGDTWSGGTAVVPLDQPELLDAARALPQRVVGFGEHEPLRFPGTRAVLVRSVRRVRDGIAGELVIGTMRFPFRLPVHGLHQARNLAAAVGACIHIARGIEWLDEALERADWSQLTAGRGNRHHLADGILLVDDAYNANPESTRAAIAELEAVDARRRVAVLGFMAELGPTSTELHRQLGDVVAASTIDQLVVVATAPEAIELARSWEAVRDSEVLVYASVDDACADLGGWLRPHDAVLVKGSNSVGLGRLVSRVVELLAVDDAQDAQETSRA